jgi:hypothetical protein
MMLNDELIRPEISRPAGIVVLAGLLILLGLFIIWDRSTSLIRAQSLGVEVVIHPAYYVDRTRDAVTAITAIMAAAGLITHHRWGWYLTVFHIVWRLASDWILPVLSGLLTERATAPSLPIGAALVLAIALAYLMGRNVMASFRVDPTERLRAVAITAGLAVPIAACFELLKVIVSDPLVVGPHGL